MLDQVRWRIEQGESPGLEGGRYRMGVFNGAYILADTLGLLDDSDD